MGSKDPTVARGRETDTANKAPMAVRDKAAAVVVVVVEDMEDGVMVNDWALNSYKYYTCCVKNMTQRILGTWLYTYSNFNFH